jgi:predicted transglutaminase-like cysteine proteinase|tara:strand:+ start:146 stop:430 length:285 start_codon:yes stop_codon:yes gene_type:complete
MADLYKTVGSERIKLTDEEVAQYEKDTKELGISDTDRKKSKLRHQRKKLLEEADWQINKKIDNNEDATSWRTYRQALRDITNSPDNPTWPTKPS